MKVNLKSIYSGKKVLITGHTGFKGSWLSLWLKLLGANVIGLSYDIPTKPSHYKLCNLKNDIKDYKIDIRDYTKLKNSILKIKPDFIFHLAAQPIVRTAYQNPLNTFMTNSIGTINLLEALRFLEKKMVVVFITSDKVYDNLELKRGYVENDRLGGKDPYSSSKGMAELAFYSYFNSYFNKNKIKIVVARAGNVIGGGDWAKNRILTDCVISWSKNQKATIRNPLSTRPWQHVLEPLSGYLLLGAQTKLSNNLSGQVFNFGPQKSYTVNKLINEMSKFWDRVDWKILKNNNSKFESSLLKLNSFKAKKILNWNQILTFNETVGMTINWYKYFYENKKNDIKKFSISQIKEYQNLANSRNATWKI